MTRSILPNRRPAVTFAFHHQQFKYHVTCGYAPNGHLAEIFINSSKQDSAMDASAKDAAILTSLALQYGAPIPTIQAAMLRDNNGVATTAIGATVDEIVKRGMICLGSAI